MRRTANKKGFTIVELVIVIAVIAILAGVMIPTFGGVIKKANISAVQQEATAVYKEVYAIDLSDGELSYDVTAATYAAAGGELLDGATFTYSEDAFVYTTEKYVATYTYDTDAWTVVEADAETTTEA